MTPAPPSSALLRVLPVTFTRRDAERVGLTRSTLYRLQAAGKIESVGRGMFARLDAPPVDYDLAEIATKSERATLCLFSALVVHGLTDDVPAATDVALPRGAWAPRVVAPVTWHRFDAASFDVGRYSLPLPGTPLTIGIYSAERTIADMFRTRGIGRDSAVDATRRWLARKGSHPADLLEVARQVPRALKPVQQTLEILG